MSRAQHEWLLYLYAESPLHAGAADASGVIDLPIRREAATGLPVVWGQSLKGALRQAARENAEWSPDAVKEVFGSEPPMIGDEGGAGHSDTAAGLLTVGDAQLLALPVPTLQSTFAWATSGLLLGRLARKYRVLQNCARRPNLPRLHHDVALAAGTAWCGEGRDEVLGPLVVPLAKERAAEVTDWARRIADDGIGDSSEFAPFHRKMLSDLLFVDDTAMRDLCRDGTEIVAGSS
ncbi:type III-B CRISPR module RAMP protein Cmr4 [Streptomyces sp. INA 01156]